MKYEKHREGPAAPKGRRHLCFRTNPVFQRFENGTVWLRNFMSQRRSARSGPPKRRPRKGSGPPRPRPDETPPPPTAERLQKVLAQAGVGSRRQCEELIEMGRVQVDGVVVKELGVKVDPSKQTIVFDGQTLQNERKVYIWLNKPAGVLTTSRDTHGRPTVMDFVGDAKARLFAVGRLDEESTGLLLLTNDGELANRLTHPRYGVPKTYEVLVAGKVNDDVIHKLKKGVWLAEGKAKAHDIRRMGFRGQATRLEVILCEGHNREVRRMFAKFDHKVMKLERVAIGPIRMRRLAVGSTRPASATEIDMLKELGRREARPPRVHTEEAPQRDERRKKTRTDD